MQISDEFSKFCSGLHQDFRLYGPEPQDWINGALGFVRKERWPALRDFLNKLLTGEYSDAQLQDIYRSTDAELGIHNDKGIRHFLAMVRDTIDQDVSR